MLGGTISATHLFLQNEDFPSKQHFLQGSRGYQKCCLSSFEEEHWIFLSKILPSWHHPQKMGAWNANKKHDKGCNGGRCQADGGIFAQTTRLTTERVMLDG